MRRSFCMTLVALVLVACSRDETDVLVGTLERDRVELTAEANEPIVTIAVKEGDSVAAGTRLVQLDTHTARARLAQATASVDVADRRLAELVSGSRTQEIQEARAVLEAAASAERTAVNEYTRVENIVQRHLDTQSSLDAARTQRDSAVASYRQAQSRLELLIEGTRREEIEQGKAELARAQAALAEVETSVARYSIVAPRAGKIEALPYKLGERPPAGAPVVVMLAEGTPYARVYIPEARRSQFTPGTKVRVSVDGETRDFAGIARFVSAQAQFTPYYALTHDDRSRLSYLAEIDLPDAEANRLPAGIPVQVRVAQQ